MTSATSTSDTREDYSNVSHNYDNERYRGNNNHGRPPLLTGDAEKFPWWKSKLNSHIIGIDDELWDVIEDGIDIVVDDEGKSANRKNLTEAQKKIYKKHHRAKGIIIADIQHEEFMRL